MVAINYAAAEINAKIVYYGPGLGGKTTNLVCIHRDLPGRTASKMLSLATKSDRTIFFDFLPIGVGRLRGLNVRLQLFTVPGQVFYNETRRLVLKGTDGVIFVADSQRQARKANLESFRNLEENLEAHGLRLADIPHVLQFNKRDLPNLCTSEELNESLNQYGVPWFESIATEGLGVHETLKAMVKPVLADLSERYSLDLKVVL